MRGGTSKGLYFLGRDLPANVAARDRVLLAAMGSPDARQIDGMGGAHPLTSKVAVIGPSSRDDADIDYLFLQVQVDTAEVRDNQNCGNILAGVGPFAIEQGLMSAQDGETAVRIHMVNTGSIAVARIKTPKSAVGYSGDARIDGVPGTAAPVMLDFEDGAGSNCGALLPTGNASDRVKDVEVSCIDNGMPVVILRAADFGKVGDETPEALEADPVLKARLESIRLAIGPRMNLGDVTKKTVPKMCLVSRPFHGGVIGTRSFHSASRARIHRCARCSHCGGCLPGPGFGRATGVGLAAFIRHASPGHRAPDRLPDRGHRSAYRQRRAESRAHITFTNSTEAHAGSGVRVCVGLERRMKIGLLGFGEVGQAIGADLLSVPDVTLCAYDVLFADRRSVPSVAIELRHSIVAAATAIELVADRDLVICAVTAAQDVVATRSIAAGLVQGSFVLDLNSVSPDTKCECAQIIDEAGGRYVEAAVMSPIAPKRIRSPVLLGGPHAKDFLPVAEALGFAGARVVSEEVGQASATKMCRSVIIKGLEALLAESLLTARYYRVENDVLDSLRDLLKSPDWPALAQYMIGRSIEHGTRRAEEMREVAATVRSAGLDAWMSDACVKRQDWSARFHDALDAEELPDMLDSMRREISC